jgi:hypothetical protein
MLKISVLSGEATNTNFIVFGLTRSGIDPMIYHTRGEHANHYTNDEVRIFLERNKFSTLNFLPFQTQIQICKIWNLRHILNGDFFWK